MVEMDVGEEEMPDVVQLEPVCAQTVLERGDACRRAAIEESRAVLCLEEVNADHALGALVS
jgi:hypothetical protein